MKKLKLISRILAIIGLVCAAGFTVCLCLSLFNLDNESIGGFLGTLTLVLFLATLIFFIPAYVFNKRVREWEESNDQPPVNDESEDKDVTNADVDAFADDSVFGGKTDDGDDGAAACGDDVPDGKGKKD